MSLASKLYSASKAARDVRALRSPEALSKRLQNKAISRGLGMIGVWRALSKLWRR